jgi:putative ABC transport system ATP-binding protein
VASEKLFETSALTREFRLSRSAPRLRALDGIDLAIDPGEFIVVRGPSGCGKTTLLLTLGGLRRPTAGQVQFEARDLYALDEASRGVLRAGPIGFVFQEMHLLPYLGALANVVLADTDGGSTSRAEELLQALGLGERMHHRPAQLSAGERQRVAVARALVRRPKVILADEPTGSLDPENAAIVLGQLRDFHRSGGTVLLVTHAESPAVPSTARSLHMAAGRLL